MEHGSYKQYYDEKDKFIYSEHAGLLDFSNSGLEKIIVYANTNRISMEDDEILLPCASRWPVIVWRSWGS